MLKNVTNKNKKDQLFFIFLYASIFVLRIDEQIWTSATIY